jgi:hypothetical protein
MPPDVLARGLIIAYRFLRRVENRRLGPSLRRLWRWWISRLAAQDRRNPVLSVELEKPQEPATQQHKLS